jgi:hypothetical protein
VGPLLGAIVILALVALAIALSVRALGEIRQLRAELDETQRQVNELRTAAEVVPAPPPPPLPRSRSSGLEDLRERLRAAHREEGREQ